MSLSETDKSKIYWQLSAAPFHLDVYHSVDELSCDKGHTYTLDSTTCFICGAKYV